MNTVWTPLLPAALVGTSRHTAPLPAWPGAVGQAIAQAVAAAPEPALAVLRSAAVLAACSAAGVQAARFSAALPAPAAQETRPVLADSSTLALLTWALQDGPPRLQHQMFAALAHAGLLWPPQLLPQVLEVGRRSLALRPLLLPTLGARGIWLAGLRDEWRFAAGTAASADLPTQWEEGSFEQRRALLQAERRQEPAAARQRLATAWPELPARERAELLAVLAEQLGADDEALLDQGRQDRSREVRQAALALLLRLPQAAHPQRAAARVAALLQQQRVLLARRWVIDAPGAAPEDAKAEQLDNPRPQHDSLGERGWWLYQLVRQVPLPWWSSHTGMDAAALLAWAQQTDWAEALLRGWRDVLFAAPDSAWCEALLARWPTQGGLREDRAGVLALLPAAQRERHWLHGLQDGSTPLDTLVLQVLAACPAGHGLSAALSAAIAQALLARHAGGALVAEHSLRGALPELAAALHLSTLPSLGQITHRPDDPPSWADTLHTLAQVLATRQALHSLNPESPS